MKPKIFIDGQEGTTGLKIHDRLKNRTDITLLQIPEAQRKNLQARVELAIQSDLTFLCLPDVAAREMAMALQGKKVRILDASTAHRTNADWAYGFPELSPAHRTQIQQGNRVAVPGCYATGFIACVYPLVQAGVLPQDYPLTCYGISGYSGGGKKMIGQMEAPHPATYDSPRHYALEQNHKHLPEMQAICGLTHKPMFNPIVANYYSGMVVSVPLLTRYLAKPYTPEAIHSIMDNHYSGQPFIEIAPLGGGDLLQDGFLPANQLSDTDKLRLFICGNEEQILVTAQLDNLGKGASGAAVQCMDLMLGLGTATSEKRMVATKEES